MWPLFNRLAPYALVASVVFAIAACGWRLGVDQTEARWAAKWNKQAAELEAATAQAERIQRDEERRRQAIIDEVRNDAQKQIEQAAADTAAANAAADSLRDQAKRLAVRASAACGHPHPALGSKATRGPGVVLADVLARADQAAGQLAAAYDRARAAGAACERAYDALTSGAQ